MTGNLRNAALVLLTASATLLLAAPTAPAEETRLNGIVYPDASDCQDGKVCKLYFELRGKDAELVYNAMRAKPKDDECVDGLYKLDRQSGLYCYKAGAGDFGCFFGYALDERSMIEGKVSC